MNTSLSLLELFWVWLPANAALLIYLSAARVRGNALLRFMVGGALASAGLLWYAAFAPFSLELDALMRPLIFAVGAALAATAIVLLLAQGRVLIRHNVLDTLLINAIAVFTAQSIAPLAVLLNPLVLLGERHVLQSWYDMTIAFWPSALIVLSLWRKSDDARLRWVHVLIAESTYLLLIATTFIPTLQEMLANPLARPWSPFVAAFLTIHVAVLASTTAIAVAAAVIAGRPVRALASSLLDMSRVSVRVACVAWAAFGVGAFIVITLFGGHALAYAILLAVPAIIELLLPSSTKASRGSSIDSPMRHSLQEVLLAPRVALLAAVAFGLFVYTSNLVAKRTWTVVEGFLTSENWLEIVRFATGACVALCAGWILASVLQALKIHFVRSAALARVIVLAIVVGGYVLSQSVLRPAPHLASGRDQGQIDLERSSARIYRWREITDDGARNVVYLESRVGETYAARTELCTDEGNNRLVSFRALDEPLIECEWERPFGDERSRFRVLHARGGIRPHSVAAIPKDATTMSPYRLRALDARDIGDGLMSCRLEAASMPLLKCNDDAIALPLQAGLTRWYVDHSQRYEYATEGPSYLCLTAEADSTLPYEPPRRGPALVVVRWKAQDAVPEIAAVADAEASCERLENFSGGDYLAFRNGDLRRRRVLATYTQLFPTLNSAALYPEASSPALNLERE